MIEFLVAVAALLGFAMLIAYASGKPLEVTLLPTCCAAIIALFVGGAAGHLATTQAWVLRIGVIAFTIAMITTRARCLRWLAEPGPVLIGALLLFVAWINRNGAFTVWDEFSQWGQVSRFLHASGSFPTAATQVPFLDYPFGAGLFHYLFNSDGGYSEISAINSHAFLQAASFLALFAGLSWRQWPLALCFAVISLSIGYAFTPSHWTSVLIDNPLSIVAAGVILVYWRGGADWVSVLLTVPVLASLPLLKESGALFAYIGLTVIVLDIIVQSVGARALSLRSVGALAAAAAAVWLVRHSWAAHVQALHASKTFQTGGDAILARLNAAEFGPYAAALVQRFVKALSGTPIGSGHFSSTRWATALLSLGLLSTLVRPTWHWFMRAMALHVTLAIAFVVYTSGLLALYLFSFWTYEGSQLASFERYMGGYVLFWLVATLAALAPKTPWKSWRSILAFAILLTVAAGSIRLARHPLVQQVRGDPAAEHIAAFRAARQAVTSRLGDSVARIPTTASVYIVWTGSAIDVSRFGATGVEHRIIRYELTPRRSSLSCWSLGPARFPGDIWSCDLEPDNAARTIGEFDYLFIGHADDIFWSKYGSLFAPGAQEADTRWFKFQSDDTGARVLVPVK